jgi:hypothetical protein
MMSFQKETLRLWANTEGAVLVHQNDIYGKYLGVSGQADLSTINVNVIYPGGTGRGTTISQCFFCALALLHFVMHGGGTNFPSRKKSPSRSGLILAFLYWPRFEQPGTGQSTCASPRWLEVPLGYKKT